MQNGNYPNIYFIPHSILINGIYYHASAMLFESEEFKEKVKAAIAHLMTIELKMIEIAKL